MQQLSRPYQIALGALVVLALAWFTFLKPSAAAEEPAPPPPVTAPGVAGLGRAVDKAKGAAATPNANAAASQAAAAAATDEPGSASAQTPAATGKPAPSTARRGAVKLPPADPSGPILREVARGKVAVLLFFSADGADDRAVRRALRAAARHGGKVVVRVAPISRVAKYAAITQGVDVLQSPTLVVIGKDNRARTLVGFTDTLAIDQLVADVGGADFRRRR